MRWLAHVMVLLLSCAALVNSLLVQVEVRSGREAEAVEQEMRTGSVVIYKSSPGMPLPQVRQAAGLPSASADADCPVGYCQDV